MVKWETVNTKVSKPDMLGIKSAVCIRTETSHVLITGYGDKLVDYPEQNPVRLIESRLS